jgi:hypothetical protein
MTLEAFDRRFGHESLPAAQQRRLRAPHDALRQAIAERGLSPREIRYQRLRCQLRQMIDAASRPRRRS